MLRRGEDIARSLEGAGASASIACPLRPRRVRWRRDR